MYARPRWRAFRSAALDGPKSWPTSLSSLHRRRPVTLRARPSPLTVRPAMRCKALTTVIVLIVIGATAGAQTVVPAPPPAESTRSEFSEFLVKLKEQALASGVSAATVESALTGLEPLEVVVERDRTQAETVLTIDQYLERRLTRRFVRTATERARAHRRSSAPIAKKDRKTVV